MVRQRQSRKSKDAGSILRGLLDYDWWLVLATAILILVGIMSLYSIDFGAAERGPDQASSFFAKQVFRLAIGFIPFFVMLSVRTRVWTKFAVPLYVINLAVLALVLVAGQTRGGAQRWLQFGPIDFQPSEMAKLVVILTLTSFYVHRLEHIKKLSTFVLGFVHVAFPMVLIYKQPHLGATLVVLAIWLTISLIAGVPLRYVIIAIVLGIAALVAAFFVPGVMDAYQRERVLGLFSPDEKTTGFHTRTAEIAFGSGGFMGTGFLKGVQKGGGYVPEQESDFIFTVVGEEGGLVGSFLVLAAFGLLFGRLWWILFTCKSRYHQMIMAGIFAVLTFHTIANLGMILRILPVVGLWLPFLSYGGTSLWLCMSLIGLALNIKRNEDDGEMFSSSRL